MSAIENLKNYVIGKTYNKSFVHHEWYYEHHLKIVEQLCIELGNHYPKANKEVMEIMVRMHDYDKICDIWHQHRDSEYSKVLKRHWYNDEIINQTLEYVDLMEKKNEIDISQSPIEVQIISSADGASHFIWPFMYIHWKEKQHKEISELMEDNIKKAIKDRTRKITLPEAKKFIEPRYQLLMEQMWQIPATFL